MSKKNLSIDDLAINPVNPASPVPLYHQIESDLRRLIASGALSPEDMLPPELELSKAYGVGRHTMREALSRLAADDLITRRAGRGTIVNPVNDRITFFLDRSFTRQMAAMGRVAHSQVLDTDNGRIDQSHPKELAGKRGAPYFYLQRLRLGDNEPIGLQSTVLITERCPNIEHHNFGQVSLYAVLSQDYQIVISRIEHTVSALAATDLQAELLQIELGTPLLMVKTAAYADDIIEFTTSYYRADRYEYSTTATF